jgi:hypothetical protein
MTLSDQARSQNERRRRIDQVPSQNERRRKMGMSVCRMSVQNGVERLNIRKEYNRERFYHEHQTFIPT